MLEYNCQQNYYFEQHKLSNGQFCRIEFIEIKQGEYGVVFAVADKKRNLRGYMEETSENTLTLKSTGRCGLEPFIWCKDKMLEAETEISGLRKLFVLGEDSRRFRIYEKALKRYGYRKENTHLGFVMVKHFGRINK